jgi:hypothetical protein
MPTAELLLTLRSPDVIEARQGDDAVISARLCVRQWDQTFIEVFQSWLERDQISERRELELFGALLYQLLFPSTIEGVFLRARDALPEGEKLRTLLKFEEEGLVWARIPWEFLCEPGALGGFLGLDERLTLSRILPSARPPQETFSAQQEPLRLLLVISRPHDLGPVIDEDTVRELLQLERSQAGRIQLQSLRQPTRASLQEKLQEFRPHLLHFLGHARFNTQKNQGELGLCGKDGAADWCGDKLFVDLQARERPRLILLHACEGGAVRFGVELAGLAPRLLRAGASAVVGMHYPVSNRAMIRFSEVFYRELGAGRHVDVAVQSARRELTRLSGGAASRLWGAPVLYHRRREPLVLSQGLDVEGGFS